MSNQSQGGWGWHTLKSSCDSAMLKPGTLVHQVFQLVYFMSEGKPLVRVLPAVVFHTPPGLAFLAPSLLLAGWQNMAWYSP